MGRLDAFQSCWVGLSCCRSDELLTTLHLAESDKAFHVGTRGRLLIQSQSDMGRKAFETGSTAPESGIYRVIHVAHRLPHEVAILKGERFPRCAKCADAVLFDLIHAVPHLSQHTTCKVYELPVLADEEASA